jgi:hypothetical protein
MLSMIPLAGMKPLGSPPLLEFWDSLVSPLMD